MCEYRRTLLQQHAEQPLMTVTWRNTSIRYCRRRVTFSQPQQQDPFPGGEGFSQNSPGDGIRSCKTSTNTVFSTLLLSHFSIGHPHYIQYLRTHPLFDECVSQISLAGGHAERKKEGKNERKGTVSIQHRVSFRVRVLSFSLFRGKCSAGGQKQSEDQATPSPSSSHLLPL